MASELLKAEESEAPGAAAPGQIELRGVHVHNLKHIDLDIPHGQYVVLCGRSGSGKSSLAISTLFAEGQRRYIESFSAYTRQFLQKWEKPAAERIDGIPPAVAVREPRAPSNRRSTVGTATETIEYLRLLMAKIALPICPRCSAAIRKDSTEAVVTELGTAAADRRVMVAFPLSESSADDSPGWLVREGFHRMIEGSRTVEINESGQFDIGRTAIASPSEALNRWVVVDRVKIEAAQRDRLAESLETAFHFGHGAAAVFIELSAAASDGADPAPQTLVADSNSQLFGALPHGQAAEVDNRTWWRVPLSHRLACERCGIELPEPEPQLFNFNHSLGACETCEGFGSTSYYDIDLIVPDAGKTLRQGAIAPWNTPAYEHELRELKALARDYNVPLDVPFRELGDEALRIIWHGVPERAFGGLNGFFRWLEKRKYKMHLRIFVARWRSYKTCSTCNGQRLGPSALAFRVGGRSIAEISDWQVDQLVQWLGQLELLPWQLTLARSVVEQLLARLRYLQEVGLGYLSLGRPLRGLSTGELQRIAMTSALGSTLVNVLYVLDEPSVGLHANDVERMITAIDSLHRRGNTLVVIEHEPLVLKQAERLIEFGPGAGEDGGTIVFDGSARAMMRSRQSVTGDFLAGRRGKLVPKLRRPHREGRIRLTGASGHNLKNIDVDFPLGVLCVVTGVSGAGKSSLVRHTLYPALLRELTKEPAAVLPYLSLSVESQIEDVILVDSTPMGRTARSNPVTYVKAFDEIRKVFAATADARSRNLSASHFSFNVAGGRCDKCEGQGMISVDMHFLADVLIRCEACGGSRYREEILQVQYRQRNIADVLEMTVQQALTFFRGQTAVQAKLKPLIDVGLQYLRLGQPAPTLSRGESQRLRLALFLGNIRRKRTLFLLDEPTTGLHGADTMQLLECFEALLSVGHSLIVIEHDLHMISQADYVIDLGPGPAELGGQVVATGTPEEIKEHPESVTAPYLKAFLSSSNR